MAMNGDTLGEDIVDELKSAGVIQTEKEVHEWTISTASAGTYTLTVDHADWDETREVEYEAEDGESKTDIRDGLKAAAEADALANALFDWSTPSADVVRSTVKSPGGSYVYGSAGNLTDAAGAAVSDASIEADALATWKAIGVAIVSHIDTAAELNSTSTGSPGVID